MSITINGREFPLVENAPYSDYLSRMPEIDLRAVLALQVSGEDISPRAVPKPGSVARTLTFRDEEGRRIYERTLQFLFLMAVRRALGPEQRVRIEHSLGKGIYIALEGIEATDEIAARIDSEMRALSKADIPFESHAGTRREALRYFETTGQTDKVRLLNYRNFEHFLLYSADGMLEYFYGGMAPSTGYVSVFRVLCCAPGLLLMMPDPANPSEPAPFRPMPKLKAAFSESSQWNRWQHVTNAADINDRIVSGDFRELVRICEGQHERAIYQIADRFMASGARLMLIAGPSSSGKTTFAKRMQTALTVLGVRSVRVSLDDYYIDRNKLEKDENGQYDFEKLEALDVALLGEQLAALLRGEEVEIPEFDFNTGRRKPQGHLLRVGPDQPIVIEGIHGLNERLTATVPRDMKFKIYTSALTTLNLDDHNRIRTTDMRLLRRIVRDHQFRGTRPEDTIAMWPIVRRGEENYIFPYQEEADVMFNSSLAYEPAIMKKYAYPLLKAVSPDDPGYSIARRLCKFLNYIYSADALDEVPPGSILREFVGGSCYA